MTDLPSGWKTASLKELGVVAQPGFASGRHNTDGEGVIHLRPMNISRDGLIDLSVARFVEDSSNRRVIAGDVLFNNTNSPSLVGKTAFVESIEPLAYSNHMTRLRCQGGLEPDFLAVQLHWLWMQGYFKTVLNNHVNQASVASKVLLQTKIVVPPVAEQISIVRFLEESLSKVWTARERINHANLKAKALDQAIVDSTVAEGEDLPKVAVKALLREPLRNGHSARATGDGTGIRTLTLSAVTNQSFTDEYTKLTSADPTKVASLWLEPGDLLVERSNTRELVGTSALYSGPSNWAIFPDLLIRVRVNNLILPEYLALLFSGSRVRRRFKNLAKGLSGSMPKIDQRAIEETEISVPAIADQAKMCAAAKEARQRLGEMNRAIRSAEVKNEAMAMNLLSFAFSGRLAGSDAVPPFTTDSQIETAAVIDRLW